MQNIVPDILNLDLKKKRSMLRIFKPTTLRGNLERNKFFEGWFQKIYSKEQKASIVIIYTLWTSGMPSKGRPSHAPIFVSKLYQILEVPVP